MKHCRWLAALACFAVVGDGHAQDILPLLEQSRCTLPVYFPVETYYAGKLTHEKSRIKIQVNDFGTAKERDDFLRRSPASKDAAFAKTETVHEFTTSGELPFGDSPTDVYMGLEKSGDRYFFKVRGAGEKVKSVKLNYRYIPPHGLVVIQEIDAVEYVQRILKSSIAPALARCK
jgi:hypothetical protein